MASPDALYAGLVSVILVGCANAPERSAADVGERPRDVMAEWHAAADQFDDRTKVGAYERQLVMDRIVASLTPAQRRALIPRFPGNAVEILMNEAPPHEERTLYDALARQFITDGATDDLVALLSQRFESGIGVISAEGYLARRVPNGILLLGRIYDRATTDGVRRHVVWAVHRARNDNRLQLDAVTEQIRWPFPDRAAERAYVAEYLDGYSARRGEFELNDDYAPDRLLDFGPEPRPLFVPKGPLAPR